MCNTKMENENYHTVRTELKYNRNIVENRRIIYL